mmetsp:Transcript_9217/g.15803  ORF Transcript_9217/g.15803 Transcript_9217/m.15803 type:complete len:90 (+) Transcript_9217:682-951(+)
MGCNGTEKKNTTCRRRPPATLETQNRKRKAMTSSYVRQPELPITRCRGKRPAKNKMKRLPEAAKESVLAVTGQGAVGYIHCPHVPAKAT